MEQEGSWETDMGLIPAGKLVYSVREWNWDVGESFKLQKGTERLSSWIRGSLSAYCSTVPGGKDEEKNEAMS